MTKVTGVFQEVRGADILLKVRVRASAPWAGMTTDLKIFDIAEDGSVEMVLPPTPRDRVYLVDIVQDVSLPFAGQESWTVPMEDCKVEEIRNFSLSYVTHIEKENDKLKYEKKQLEDRRKIAVAASSSIEQDARVLRSLIASLEARLEKSEESCRVLKQENASLQKELTKMHQSNATSGAPPQEIVAVSKKSVRAFL